MKKFGIVSDEKKMIPEKKKKSKKTDDEVGIISIVTEYIYFGSFHHSVENTEIFARLNINTVINCGDEKCYPDNITFSVCNFNYDDSENGSSLMEYIDDTIKIINDCVATKKKVYIQCKTGNSISPAILIYLYMMNKQYTYHQAYEKINKIRSTIDINRYFINELITIDEWCSY
jgi:Dual specificity phosphatase, catalytic domain